MSYIHCSHVNHYKLIGSLQNFFEELIGQPFKNHALTQPWEYYVKNRNSQYHRVDILKRGRTNFNEPFESLSPKDKVLIYCFYYMPMHLFSSYHIFTGPFFPSLGDKVVFIDFGCGPLTSGVAFWAFARQSDIIYLGIDNSQAMLDKAKEVNEYGPDRWKPFFDKGKFELICDYDHLAGLLDKYIEKDDKTQIIFNFCYFLASETLVIRNLFDVLIRIVEKYNQRKMFVVYQNPPIPERYSLQTSKFHKNWYFLKTQLSMFQSQITQSNTEQFSYDSLVNGLPDPRDLYFDILSSEVSAPFNNQFDLLSIF